MLGHQTKVYGQDTQRCEHRQSCSSDTSHQDDERPQKINRVTPGRKTESQILSLPDIVDS